MSTCEEMYTKIQTSMFKWKMMLTIIYDEMRSEIIYANKLGKSVFAVELKYSEQMRRIYIDIDKLRMLQNECTCDTCKHLCRENSDNVRIYSNDGIHHAKCMLYGCDLDMHFDSYEKIFVIFRLDKCDGKVRS